MDLLPLCTINGNIYKKVTELQKEEHLIKIEIKTLFLCFTNSSFSLQLFVNIGAISLAVSKSAYKLVRNGTLSQKASITMLAKYL
jgi:hypothetical protein